MTTYRVSDVMETDLAVTATDDETPTDSGVVIQSEADQIERVSVRAITDGSVKPVSHTVARVDTMLLEALTGMLAAEAQIILVSRHPDSDDPKDITGVVSPAAIARFLKSKADLL